MKKTIVIEPERTETYTEMVPCMKTRTIPAKTEEVEVGPGYVPIYRSRTCGWFRNGWGGTPKGYPMYDSVEEMLAEEYCPGVFSTNRRGCQRSVLYVPAGVSVDDALAALNALKPVCDAKAPAEIPF